MSLNRWLSKRIGTLTRKASVDLARRPRPVLVVELLEERTVPSAINWVNEHDPANNFGTVFGARAALATRVVEAAVDSWANVIRNFHTSSNTFSVNISVDPTNAGAGAGTIVTASENGIPTAATMTIEAGPGGHGSYLFLDPTVPADPSQFDPVDSYYLGTNQNAFASNATHDTGLRDLYSLVLHEMGHAVGFSTGDSAPPLRLTTTPYIHDISNPTGNPLGDDILFQGPDVTTLLTTGNNGNSASTAPIHADYYDHSGSYNGQPYIGSDDLMVQGLGSQIRRLISDSDAFVLKDVYGYDIVRPDMLNNFYIALDPTSGQLIVRGNQFANASRGFSPSNDTVTLSTSGGWLDVYVGIGMTTPGEYSNPNPIHESYPLSSVNSIYIYPGAGNTGLTIDDSADIQAYTGAFMSDSSVLPGWGVIGGLGSLADVNYQYMGTTSVTVHTSAAAGDVLGISDTGVPTHITNHAAATVNVGVGAFSNTGSLQGIQYPVSVDSTSSLTMLNIDDSGDGSAQSFIIGTNAHDSAWGFVHDETLPNFSIDFRYGATSSLQLNTGTASDNVVDVWQDGAPTTIRSRGPHTTIDLGNGNNGLDDLPGLLTILGDGSDNLTVDDRANPDSYPTFDTITNTSIGRQTRDAVGRPRNATITYSGLGSVELDTGGFGFVFVEGTAVPTTVNAGPGNQAVLVSSQAENLDNLPAPLTVDGVGNDQLIVDDRNNPYSTSDTVTGASITRQTPERYGVSHNATITYSGLSSVELDTGGLISFVFVEGTAVPTTVNAGAGNVAVEVSAEAENLDNLPAPLTVHGDGNDQLIVDDRKNPNPTPTLDTVTGASITREAWDGYGVPHNATITYSGLSGVKLDTGGLISLVFVEGTAVPTTINAAAGNRAIWVTSQAENLDNLPAPLIVHGGGNDQLVVDDRNNPNPIPTLDTITSTSINRQTSDAFGRPHNATITYSGLSSVELDSGGVVSFVFVETTAGPTTVNAGPGNRAVVVSSQAENLDNLPAPLTVHGGGNDQLIVDDRNNPNLIPTLDTITGGSVTRNAIDAAGYARNATITYSGVGGLELDTGTVPNLVFVEGTAVATTVNAGAGNLFVAVSPQAENLDHLAAALTVNGNGIDHLIVNDQNNPNGAAPTQDTITGTALTRTAFSVGASGGLMPHNASLTYSNLGGLELDAGALPNLVYVQSTAAATTVNAGAGTLLVDVSAQAENLDGIAGALTVNGAGSTPLIVNDQGSTTQEVYEVFATEVDRTHLPDAHGNYVPDMAPITYTGLSSLTLYASNSSYNLLYVEGTAAGTRTDIYGGRDNSTQSQFTVDEFVVSGGPGDTLDDILGPLNLHGRTAGSGETVVLLNDSSTAGGRIYTLTASGVGRTAMASITFDDIVYDELYTSETASAAINVQGVGANVATIVIAGAGDPVTVGSPDPIANGTTLAGIQGPLFVIAGYADQVPSVVIDDSGDPTDHRLAAITPDAPYYQLTGLAAAPIYFGLDPATPVRILGGRGNDKFTVTSAVAYTGITIDGGGGANTLVGPDAVNTWNITDTNKGTLGTVGFANMQNMVGGHLNDHFEFQTGGSIGGTLDGSVGGTLDGGGGVNTLDYSADKNDIQVDLALHLATQVAGSVSNIANVTGSQGNSLLVGDANANVLVGGAGRNVIIGGSGGDTIDAHLSQGDNIIIGGWTDWDMNVAALDAIMAEWTRTDLNPTSSFRIRYSDLLNGAGSINPLNVVNGQLILLTAATNPKSNNGTVHADGASDTLIGTNLNDPATRKRAHNWFFYDDADAALVNFLNSSDHKSHVS
jgi:hypothetical protein